QIYYERSLLFMKKHSRSRKFTIKKLLQKYLLLMFSLALVFSPFSSLSQLAYAEGDADEGNNDETIIEENDNGESNVLNDGEEDKPRSEDANSDEDEGSVEDSDAVGDNTVDSDDDEDENPEATESNNGNKSIDKENTEITVNAEEEMTIAGFMMQPLANNDSRKTPEGFEWSENQDGTITITGYDGQGGELVIPTQIYNKDVTVIGTGAFSNREITSVDIPEGDME